MSRGLPFSRMLRLTLWAQRRAGLLPAPVRRAGGRVLNRLRSGDRLRSSESGLLVPPEDWTVPLIAGRPAGNIEAVPPAVGAGPPAVSAAPPAVGRAAPATASPRATLRCVVATDVLDVGGMDEFVGFLGRRLPSAGVDTVVAYATPHQAGTYGEDGRGVRALAERGVRTVELSPATAREWLASHRPDVISAHGAPDWLLDAAAEVGLPWVETLHGMHAFLDPASWAPEVVRAKKIAAHVAVSELVRQQYLARIPGADPDRVITIPNGVDEERIRQVDRAAARRALGLRDEYLFVSLVRYCLQKNVFGLASAFAEVAAAYPDAHLLVAGRADDQRYYAQVRTLVDGLPGADRIHLRGHCANASGLLAAADGFVLDSFFEGWALASMEALTLGTPVVLSDVGGAREQLGAQGRGGQLGAGGRGYLVANPGGPAELVDWRIISDLRFRPQGNRGALVAAMSALVRDREQWAAERDRLAKEATEAFSAQACLRSHAALLARVSVT